MVSLHFSEKSKALASVSENHKAFIAKEIDSLMENISLFDQVRIIVVDPRQSSEVLPTIYYL